VQGWEARGAWVSDAIKNDGFRRQLGALLSKVYRHARLTNKSREWKDLRSRLTRDVKAEDCSYRHQVAALFEAAVLGVSVCHWGAEAELWPAVPGSRRGCDLRIGAGNATLYGEAKGLWSEEDRRPPQGGSGRAFVNNRIAELVSTVREAAGQLPSGVASVCFVLSRRLVYPGMYPDGEGNRQEVYGRVAERLRAASVQVDLLAVFHEWNLPDFTCVHGNASLEGELHTAFRQHWPARVT